MAGTPTSGPDRSVDAEQVLHAVAEASDDAILSLDGSGRVMSWNRSAERIFGYPATEIIGRPSVALFPEHLQEQMVELLATVVAGNPVDHFETEIDRKDGMPVPISITACPVFDRGARLPAAVLVARDVTEQRLAQATLAEVERRLSEAEALSRTGSWLWDRRTDTVQWSDEHHRIHGRDPLDFSGTIEGHLACIHVDDRKAVREAIARAIESGHPLEVEYRVDVAGVGVRRIYTRAESTIGSTGTAVGLRGISRDITEPGPVSPAG